MKSIIEGNEYECRVSSVLNKNITQYGKSYLFDNKEDTCWCSENKSPQWVSILWKEPVSVSSFIIQFQGGFVGKNCEIIIVGENKESKVSEPFYPEDNNCLQVFKLTSSHLAKQITLKFNASTDFFGRIIIYKLDFLS